MEAYKPKKKTFMQKMGGAAQQMGSSAIYGASAIAGGSMAASVTGTAITHE